MMKWIEMEMEMVAVLRNASLDWRRAELLRQLPSCLGAGSLDSRTPDDLDT